ncbi:long-chain-acyl-CoA synthetase [Plesiocystis pacifica]|uniref:long-chain-acyl-CoA synthetase n=1 Tax=Plesiocystis pacifica TaxID=191768 RepID=UPI0012F8C31F|nr:long-chain-acyl-CoA synthetase [Plesiocystis pacifica]
MSEPRAGLLARLRQALARTEAMGRGLETNFFWDPNSTQTIALELQRWALERPGDPFLTFEDRRWTVGSFDAAVNRHARAWRRAGVVAGETVALVLENRPAYLFHYYALAKLGVVAALINPALRGAALSHALRASEARAVVVGEGQLDGLRELAESSDADAVPVSPERVFVDVEGGLGREPEGSGAWVCLGWSSWAEGVAGCSPLPIPEVREHPLTKVVAYIYTSGTTGLPKPAVVKHHRQRRAGDVFGGLAMLTAADIVYVALPLYHASASMIGVSMTIARRAQLVLARRFSASRFWPECRAHGVTTCIYIGELCRYLHNQPPRPDDGEHEVRCFVGNGLRDDIWDGFCERFGIERVVEFYAATEGNAETANVFNLRGTVGPLLFWKMAVVRWDPARGEVVRDAKGRCVRAPFGEPGLLIGKINDRNPYAGYKDAAASQRKILRDVFAPGDAWFDTGDLLRVDRLLHLHFVDRLGDTFRWKGENVSTQEVAEQLNGAPGVLESNVYGVEVPGSEGRAGMAAIVVDGDFDPRAFYAHVSEVLPTYAQPRFLRIVAAMGTTGTFKHKKNDLRDQGWDPARVDDPLLIWDRSSSSYVTLDRATRDAALRGERSL